ncbi:MULTISPECIES: hypothetical protein [Sphingomonas]|uniref:hypothetical protein n=1 Tax=Sphingomonas TaxID=13687 RepID=UPI001966916D|nr:MULTISPECIES: hypothetical protein [Sphingomonas]
MKPKKSKLPAQSDSGIKKAEVKPPLLKFSFRLFDASDDEACPAPFKEGYVQALMERLKSLSGWTVKEFATPQGRAVRNHTIDWSDTARPEGFSHLNEQLRAYEAHQFSVSANLWGRVHGILIDDTFHVVWLDQNHVVYP